MEKKELHNGRKEEEKKQEEKDAYEIGRKLFESLKQKGRIRGIK